MKSSERPPLKHKKGIQVVQPSHPCIKSPPDSKYSEIGSMHSTSRSRGISISRQSGITIDKIYDSKHFLPPKSSQQQIVSAQSQEMKTLTSVRSLKLISMFADFNAQSSHNGPSGIRQQRKEPVISQFKVQKGQLGSLQNRCNSPILKLASTQEGSQIINGKSETRPKLNILKF